jgi:hypothetical protein
MIFDSRTHTEKTKIDKGHQSTESESNNAHRHCVPLSTTRSEEGTACKLLKTSKSIYAASFSAFRKNK